MRTCNISVMLLTAISTGALARDHGIFSARDLMDNSYMEPLQVRDPDNLVLKIHRRGQYPSKPDNRASQRPPSNPILTPAPKMEKPLQPGAPRTSRSVRIPSEVQNAEKRTLPPSLGPGRTTRRPQILQSSEPVTASVPRRPAGGGFIGHSRIPPRVPKEYSRVEPLKVPPSPAEEMGNKSPDKNDQSQRNANQKDGGNSPREYKSWDPSDEGRSLSRGRPPALTSIDDF